MEPTNDELMRSLFELFFAAAIKRAASDLAEDGRVKPGDPGTEAIANIIGDKASDALVKYLEIAVRVFTDDDLKGIFETIAAPTFVRAAEEAGSAAVSEWLARRFSN